MNTTKISLIVFSLLFAAACSTSKKSSTAGGTPVPAATAAARPANGVYAPGEEELSAVRERYSGVTLEQLQEGHALYTKGACINCHGAKNIYTRKEAQWKAIIDDMAGRSRISGAQKDAVYKYVMAIKAVQAKEGK